MKIKKKIYTNKLRLLFDLLFFILLVYNLAFAKIIPSLIALLLFLMASPLFFRKFKTKHYSFMKKLNIIMTLPMLIFLFLSFIPPMTGSIPLEDQTIPEAEQHYIDTILTQITTESSKDDAILLLGKPDRDQIAKVNWWVNIDGRDSRVGIYFSPSTGNAYEIVLDGGVGSFYYRETLEIELLE